MSFKWYKGNIHTHTNESDGDASPDVVVKWYRKHDYDFLVLSDHNHLTLLNYGERKRRLKRPFMIPGEEVTLNIHQGKTAIHINGIGISRVVEPVDAVEVVPTLQANINAILNAGGIASINHPNYTWAFDHEAISQVTGVSLLEIFNGHHVSNICGAPGKFSYEEIWDGVLSTGKVIFGVATDDSHHYYDFTHTKANPGRGWVVVRAEELSVEAIIIGLETGDFYASTGVTLEDLVSSQKEITLSIRQERDFIYTTRFTGRKGKIHAEIVGTEAAYRIRGDEGYVRATVVDSSGKKAWVQPVFPP